MKIRSGFVSNSSSSSFIIGCDKVPDTVLEMKELLGELKDVSYSEYSSDYKTSKEIPISETEIAKQVFKDMEKISLEDQADHWDDFTHKQEITEDSYVNTKSYNNYIKEELANHFSVYFDKDKEEILKYLDANDHYDYVLRQYFENIAVPEVKESINKFMEERNAGTLGGRISWYEYDTNLGNLEKKVAAEIKNKVTEVYSKYRTKAIKDLLESKEFFKVTYGDDEGSYFAAFEHSNIFRNTKVATKSMH
jgi:hypothetical protein